MAPTGNVRVKNVHLDENKMQSVSNYLLSHTWGVQPKNKWIKVGDECNSMKRVYE